MQGKLFECSIPVVNPDSRDAEVLLANGISLDYDGYPVIPEPWHYDFYVVDGVANTSIKIYKDESFTKRAVLMMYPDGRKTFIILQRYEIICSVFDTVIMDYLTGEAIAKFTHPQYNSDDCISVFMARDWLDKNRPNWKKVYTCWKKPG